MGEGGFSAQGQYRQMLTRAEKMKNRYQDRIDRQVEIIDRQKAKILDHEKRIADLLNILGEHGICPECGASLPLSEEEHLCE